MGQLLLIALATFASEDLACIATGGLVSAGKLDFLSGVLACIAGVVATDLIFYLLGRLFGRAILRWRPIRKLLTEEKLDRAAKWLTERGAYVIIASRFTPGLRVPTYVAAGILKTRFSSFALYFLLSAILWAPILVGTSVLLGKDLPLAALAVPALLLVLVPWRKLNLRRRFGLSPIPSAD